MAIYHFSAQVISRGKGQSAVAAAAYRSGDRLIDERTGEEKYYRREVMPESMILAPSHSPEWVYDREKLWNEVESAEKRKDAQLAREINIALPRELTNDHQEELIKNYVQMEFVNKGMIADIAIHRDDKKNPHAHVMLTTREITAEGFGPKNRDWNDRGLLEHWREEWANHANKALEREGIQDRISHLSHEARGLEQLPTVHLGHVAAEMEKKGIETDRGNINRERQEYNRLVVDLQKYREEKQAIEQEKARQLAQKQNAERFNTPAERVDLQNASKVLKAEPSLSNIKKRYEQLDKWGERVNKNDGYIRWKDEKIREAAEHYSWIHSFEKRMEKAQQQLDSINWMNPLKIKENRLIKERSEREISHAQEQIQFHHEKLNYHREKLGFSTEKEFTQVKNQHEAERPGLLEKNRHTRQYIRSECDVLQKAENACKNAFVREVASWYPDKPEMQYISFKTATNIANIAKANGNTAVPIESMKKILNNRKQEVQRLQGEISRIDQTKTRLQRAAGHLKNYEAYHAVVEKHENNPFLKGKMLVSKTTKQEYEKAVFNRDHYHELMKREGISGRTDYEKQTDLSSKMETRIPEFHNQIQSFQKGLGILDAVLKGIERAAWEMQREQKRQQQQQRVRGKGRSKQHSQEIELGR